MTTTIRQPRGRPKVWTEDAIIHAIQRWVYDRGQTPTYEEWRLFDVGRPTSHTVDWVLGWDNAIERAGYTPRGRGRPRRER